MHGLFSQNDALIWRANTIISMWKWYFICYRQPLFITSIILELLLLFSKIVSKNRIPVIEFHLEKKKLPLIKET